MQALIARLSKYNKRALKEYLGSYLYVAKGYQ